MIAFSILYRLRNYNTYPTHIVFVRKKPCNQIQSLGQHSLIYSRGQNLHYIDNPPFIPTIHGQDALNGERETEVKKVYQSSNYPCE